MLIGTYRHSVDAKKRMRMPSKFKAELGANFVITKGNSGNLFVFSNEQFSALYEKMVSLPLFDEEAQKPIRKFLSSAFEAEEDNQGRFLLPANLREFAGITKDVVFVGVGNRAELWSEDSWNKYCLDNETNFDEIISELGKNGI